MKKQYVSFRLWRLLLYSAQASILFLTITDKKNSRRSFMTALPDMVDSAAETEEGAEPILYTEEKTVLSELVCLYQQNSDYGSLYVQENYDVQLPSDNVIIYGHHMKNGSMFADLEKFKSQDFWQGHKTFLFSIVTDRYEYENGRLVVVLKRISN